MSILLLIAIFLPLAAALIIGRNPSRARRAAIFAATFTLAAAALPACHIAAATVLPSGLGADRTAELIAVDLPWYVSTDGPLNVRFELGLDGLSVWPFILTCLAMLAAVAIGCPPEKGATGYRLLLVLQTGLLGLFAARESLLFFVFYEFSLIPFFFMVAAGNAGGRRAAASFLCIEAGGGQMVLLGLLAGMAIGGMACWWIFFVLAAGFAVRVMVPPLFCLSATPRSFSAAAAFFWLSATPKGFSAAVAFFLPAGLLALSGIYGVLRFIVKMGTDA